MVADAAVECLGALALSAWGVARTERRLVPLVGHHEWTLVLAVAKADRSQCLHPAEVDSSR